MKNAARRAKRMIGDIAGLYVELAHSASRLVLGRP